MAVQLLLSDAGVTARLASERFVGEMRALVQLQVRLLGTSARKIQTLHKNPVGGATLPVIAAFALERPLARVRPEVPD